MTEKRTAISCNPWEPPDGNGRKRWYVKFKDDSEAIVWDSKVAEAIPIGEETDFEIQPPKQEGWKPSVSWLPSILGEKPKRGGGGSGSKEYKRDMEGLAYEQERMDRRCALMQSVALAVAGYIDATETVSYTERFIEVLRSPALPKSQAAQDSDQKAGAVAPFGEDQTRPSTSGGEGFRPTAASLGSPPTVDASGPPPLDTGTGELAAAQGVTEDVAELGTTGEGVSGSAASTEPNNDPLWPAQCCEHHLSPPRFSQMVQWHRDMVEKAVAGKQLTVRSRALARWHLERAKEAKHEEVLATSET